MEFEAGVLLNTFYLKLGLFLFFMLRYKKISYTIIFFALIQKINIWMIRSRLTFSIEINFCSFLTDKLRIELKIKLQFDSIIVGQWIYCLKSRSSAINRIAQR